MIRLKEPKHYPQLVILFHPANWQTLPHLLEHHAGDEVEGAKLTVRPET